MLMQNPNSARSEKKQTNRFKSQQIMKTLIAILSLALAWGIYSNTELRSENLALHNTVEQEEIRLSNYKYALDKSVDYIRCLELKGLCSDERER